MNNVVIDACCLINLLAAEDVLSKPSVQKTKLKVTSSGNVSSTGAVLHVAQIIAAESMYLLQPELDDPSKLFKSPINLNPYFKTGVLNRCDVEGVEETSLFIAYATKLDDGEAACLAIAKNRGWSLATDDRPATSIANQAGVTVLTTAQLLKQWARNTKATKLQITEALLKIQRFAKFVPRPNSPEATWWISHLAGK